MQLASIALALLMSTIPQGPHQLQTDEEIRIWWKAMGNGPPIVVIHGGPGLDHGSLAADLAPLSKTHTLVYYDQRGGGRSSLPEDTSVLSIDDHVRDLEKLRIALGLEKVTLLAHSFGPAIAALYAIEHPDRVERMIFLGPIPPRKGSFFEDYGAGLESRLTDDDRKRADAAYANIAAGRDVVEACRTFWAVGTPPRLAKGVKASVVKADLCTASAEAIRYGMTKTGGATWDSMGDWDWREKLGSVKAPALVIHGDEDAIPLALVREWVAALPDARIIVLEKTGHFPHAEKPDIVFRAIEQFTKGTWPKAATRP
ncbi:MAG: alpha/beta fold hydrolase [Thermoanaerobaculia bacterium]